MRWGKSPNSATYYPSFPYRSYTKMKERDLQSIFQYIMSLPPVEKENRPHQLEFPFNMRWLNYFWQAIFFDEQEAHSIENVKVGTGPFSNVTSMSKEWNRGAYLVEAVLHCTECHTPRNILGAPIPSLWMSGSNIPTEEEKTPPM